MAGTKTFEVAPSAARLTGSLRDIGYDFTTAVADLVDNSIAAGASRINVYTQFVPHGSYVLISDDGVGHVRARAGRGAPLRHATRLRQERAGPVRAGPQDGIVLAVSPSDGGHPHRADSGPRFHVMTLDLNRIARTDTWDITANETSPAIERAKDLLRESPGRSWSGRTSTGCCPSATRRPDGDGGACARSPAAPPTTSRWCSTASSPARSPAAPKSSSASTATKLQPWDPFAPDEAERSVLPEQVFEVETDGGSSEVRFRGVVLPARDRFSSLEQFERLSGPQKWNRQQGLYIYRADRLVQHGGWSGLRGIDEHTKLARAAVDFDTDLDEAFQINVAKMRVELPPVVKQMLERPVHELCVLADDAYRRSANAAGKPDAADQAGARPRTRRSATSGSRSRPRCSRIDRSRTSESALDLMRSSSSRTWRSSWASEARSSALAAVLAPSGERTCGAVGRLRRAHVRAELDQRDLRLRLSSSKPISRPTAMRPSELRFLSHRSVPWKKRPATRRAPVFAITGSSPSGSASIASSAVPSAEQPLRRPARSRSVVVERAVRRAITDRASSTSWDGQVRLAQPASDLRDQLAVVEQTTRAIASAEMTGHRALTTVCGLRAEQRCPPGRRASGSRTGATD